MKHFITKNLVLLFFLFTISRALAYQFSVNGIYYNIYQGKAIVTYPNSSMYSSTNSSYKGEVNIPNRVSYNNTTYDVTEIGTYAFHKSSVTKVTLPNTIEKIGGSAFYGCTNLTSINLPDNVTTVESGAFTGCTALTMPLYNSSLFVFMPTSACGTSYVVPEGITDILGGAFNDCTNLMSITFPSSLQTIKSYAFQGCTGLTELTVPENTQTIDSQSFSGCTNLTHVTINSNTVACKDGISNGYFKLLFGPQVSKYTLGDNITALGRFAFAGCTSITEQILPKRLKSIGDRAFQGCTSLRKIEIPDSVVTFGQYLFQNCTALAEPVYNKKFFVFMPSSYSGHYTIPLGITEICTYAFTNCTNLTGVTLTDSVRTINSWAFQYSGLTSVDIPENVTAIYSYAFYSCKNLKTAKIAGLTTVGNYMFANCSSLSDVTFLSAMTIYDYCFQNCVSLTSINIPGNQIGAFAFDGCTALRSVSMEKVNTISGFAFRGCVNLNAVIIPDGLRSIYVNSFPNNTTIYANKGKPSNLALWTANITPLDVNTNNKILPPTLRVLSTTQTTATLKIDNYYPEFNYHRLNGFYLGEKIDGDEFVVTGLKSGATTEIKPVYIIFGSATAPYYWPSVSVTTQSMSLSIKEANKTASSLTIVGSHNNGDANVISKKIVLNGKEYEGDSIYVTGLDPDTPYSVEYHVTLEGTADYTETASIATLPLALTTQKPKVINVGNVIVAAETNIDDEETNVGFEWRRTDWTDDFESSTGTAYLYEGTMEGYIRNLYAEKLWKYRPYYESASGNRYYGEWVGIDPTNTSYFEPTVHTYSEIEVDGNTVKVKGYVMRGTDKIDQQGFYYWKSADEARSIRHSNTITVPENAKKVVASGNIMTAEIKGLDFNSEYCIVAFVKTDENEMFYGEKQQFMCSCLSGDANDDSVVDVADVVAIVNYILEKPAENFNKAAADVNGDEVIDAADVVGVVNIILDKGNVNAARVREVLRENGFIF